jgi:predicted N-acetyltransferase YhbS
MRSRRRRRAAIARLFCSAMPPYYARFGFSAEKMAGLSLPGPFERDRLLGRELVPSVLDGARGTIIATGAVSGLVRKPPRARAA